MFLCVAAASASGRGGGAGGVRVEGWGHGDGGAYLCVAVHRSNNDDFFHLPSKHTKPSIHRNNFTVNSAGV